MTKVNLARRDDLATVRQTQESLVTEGPELTLVIRPSTSGTISGRSSTCWMRCSTR
jgi:hypothetical protein